MDKSHSRHTGLISRFNSGCFTKAATGITGRWMSANGACSPGSRVGFCLWNTLRSIQRWIKPVWKRLADGCHLDRETWRTIQAAGFKEITLEHFRLSLPVVGPHIMGMAVKK